MTKKMLVFKRRIDESNQMMSPYATKIGPDHILNQIEQRFTLPKPETGS